MSGETVAADDPDLLRSRVHVGLWLALVSISLFALADLALRPDRVPSLTLLKVPQVAAVAAAFFLLRRPCARRRVIAVTLLALAVVYAFTALPGVLIHDDLTTPILCTVVALLAATLLPWGALPQIGAVLLAGAAMLANVYFVEGGLARTIGYPAIGVVFALGTSIYIADAFQRYRREIARRAAQQRRALEALRASEADFRGLFENLQDVFYRVDLAGNLQMVSPSVERYGYRSSDLIGRKVDRFYREPAERAASVEAVLRNGAVQDAEITLERADGTPLPTSVTARVRRDEHGRPIGIEGTLRDITARKRTELEVVKLNDDLRRRAEDLEVANRELEAFSYSVSHDLRGPLRSIDGFSKMLLEDCGDQLDATGIGYLKRVRAAAQRMGQLIDDLLKLSRVTRSELRREVVNLSGLAESIVSELRQREPDRAADVVIAAGVMTVGDAVLLRVVLQNLLENAWKFSRRRERAHIEFGVQECDAGPAYFVRDNGVGFDMAHAAKLFGAFQRLHSTAEFEGTGIGLATVQRVIRRHHGRVWAESTPDMGATFFFTLSRGATAPAESEPQREAPRRSSAGAG
jgi:PAS domain S-box-containing protein